MEACPDLGSLQKISIYRNVLGFILFEIVEKFIISENPKEANFSLFMQNVMKNENEYDKCITTCHLWHFVCRMLVCQKPGCS